MIGLIKYNMKRLGHWLVGVEKMNMQRDKCLDDDLDDFFTVGSITSRDASKRLDASRTLDSIRSDKLSRPSLNNEESLEGYEEDEDDAPPPYHADEDNISLGSNTTKGFNLEDDDAILHPIHADEESVPPTYSVTFPPPSYSEIKLPSSSLKESPENSKSNTDQHINTNLLTLTNMQRYPEDTLDPVKLLFQAFVSQKNNGTQWLGTNQKLNRLKFQGSKMIVL
jgi:hypothetical protein